MAEIFLVDFKLVWPDSQEKHKSCRDSSVKNLNTYFYKVFGSNRVFSDINHLILIESFAFEAKNYTNIHDFVKGAKLHKSEINKKLISDYFANNEAILYNSPHIPKLNGHDLSNYKERLNFYWKKIILNNEILNKISDLEKKIDFNKTVALHVRRGDIIRDIKYLPINKLAKRIHTYLSRFAPLSTFKKYAQEYIESNYTVLIFSQDAVLQDIPGLVSTHGILEDEDQQAVFDLICMSKCSFIVAPTDSMFSECASIVGGARLVRMEFDYEQVYLELKNLVDEDSTVKDKDARRAIICLGMAQMLEKYKRFDQMKVVMSWENIESTVNVFAEKLTTVS